MTCFLPIFIAFKGCKRIFHTSPFYIPWVPELFPSFVAGCLGVGRHIFGRRQLSESGNCVESLLRPEFLFGCILLVFWLSALTVCMREKSSFLFVVLTNVLPERPKFLFKFTNTLLESTEKRLFLVFNFTNFIRF